MKNMGKRVVSVLGVATILGTSVFASAIASGTDIKGKIANMTIFNNGTAMSLPVDQRPIIVNDRTYLPVRALGEALDKKIDWNPSSPNSVYITGTTNQAEFNQMILSLNQAKIQIVEKDSKIKELEAKVSSLQEELTKKQENTVTNLSTFEKDLNRNYGDYEKLRLDITLREKGKDIVVDININKNYESDWDKLTSYTQEKLIENVVYDIQKEYKYPKVDGYVDAGANYSSYEFYTDNNDRLQIGRRTGTGSTSSGSYSYLERDIIDYYREVYDIRISDTSYDVVAKVELNSNNYTTSELNGLRVDIRYDIDRQINRSAKYDIYVDFYYNGQSINLDK